MTYRLKVTRINGKEYAAIVEDVYDKKRRGSTSKTLKSYGDLVKRRQLNPDIDKEIALEVERLNGNREVANLAWTNRHLHELKMDEGKAIKQINYGIVFYRKIWESLKLHTWFDRAKRNAKGAIGYDLDMAVFLLAAMRILCPMSKSKTFHSRDELILDFEALTLDNIYDALEVLANRKKTIIANLNKNLESVYTRVKTIAFYDVTTFYFESFDSDVLRARGMSKENKTNEVQVVLGLLVDGEGIPINYELFRGNTSEMKTIIEVIQQYKTENNLEKVTVVADRGLNSYLNLKTLSDLGCDYIVAQSIDRLSAKLREEILRQDNWDSITFNEKTEEKFKVKTINQSTSDNLNNKIIVTYSSKRRAHDLKVLEERYNLSKDLVKKGTGAVDASIKRGVRQFISKKRGSSVTYTTNDRLYAKRVERAGFYALTTSRTDDDAKVIYQNLRRLWHIEDCFRVMKTNLETRPVYVWTPNKIRGHFLVCYLALVMERLAYYKARVNNLTLSSHEMIETLSKAKMSVLDKTLSKKTLYLRQGISANEEKNEKYIQSIDTIFKLADIPPLATIEDIVSLTKKLKISSNASIIS